LKEVIDLSEDNLQNEWMFKKNLSVFFFNRKSVVVDCILVGQFQRASFFHWTQNWVRLRSFSSEGENSLVIRNAAL
jgi:hypothetical protein